MLLQEAVGGITTPEPDSVPGVFVTARVIIGIGDGAAVDVEVLVGMAIAVCVWPEEKVATAIV